MFCLVFSYYNHPVLLSKWLERHLSSIQELHEVHTLGVALLHTLKGLGRGGHLEPIKAYKVGTPNVINWFIHPRNTIVL